MGGHFFIESLGVFCYSSTHEKALRGRRGGFELDTQYAVQTHRRRNL
jgi:hypothetical protein